MIIILFPLIKETPIEIDFNDLSVWRLRLILIFFSGGWETSTEIGFNDFSERHCTETEIDLKGFLPRGSYTQLRLNLLIFPRVRVQ